jgi:hypothetical protein
MKSNATRSRGWHKVDRAAAFREAQADLEASRVDPAAREVLVAASPVDLLQAAPVQALVDLEASRVDLLREVLADRAVAFRVVPEVQVDPVDREVLADLEAVAGVRGTSTSIR